MTNVMREKRMKKLCPLVLKLHNKNNDKYYLLTMCQALSKRSSNHFTHINL